MNDITTRIEGRAWAFPEANINTDLMMPPRGYGLPLIERAKLIFSANRPGWTDSVREGDVLVAGRNFGTGSSRPAAQILRVLGIRAIIAESINGLFFRNCVNYGLPALECPGAVAAITEGDTIAIDLDDGLITNQRTRVELRGSRLPEKLIQIISAGGLHQQLKAAGYI